jgi:hypothetical protein
MSHPRIIVIMTFSLLVSSSAGADEAPAAADHLAPFQALEGVWEGESKGFGQISKLTHQ